MISFVSLRKVPCMKKELHGNFMYGNFYFHAWKWNFLAWKKNCMKFHAWNFMHEISYMDFFISIHESEISLHRNENFTPEISCPWYDLFAPEMYMENWAVQYFMHGNLTHEYFHFQAWKYHGILIFMHEKKTFFHATIFSCIKHLNEFSVCFYFKEGPVYVFTSCS